MHTPGVTPAHGHGASVANGQCAAEQADSSTTRIEDRSGALWSRVRMLWHPSALLGPRDTIGACLFARRASRVLSAALLGWRASSASLGPRRRGHEQHG